MIKLLDLTRQYSQIKNEVMEKIADICESQYFILGPNVIDFEEKIAKYIGVKHAISCASGSDAISLSLAIHNIGPGDEVITVPFTFFATAGAIARAHATPVFVDIDPDSFNINPDKIEEAITPKTKAIIPVHLYGQIADMDKIQAIAKKYNLVVIEDACQSIGATYKEKSCGGLGDTACFSFFPTKNLGGFGDAGLVTTNDDELARLLKMYRVHGSEKRYSHEYIGWNSRCDALQASILSIKIKYLDEWTKQRQKNAKYYDDFFTKNLADKITIPKIENFTTKHVYNQYVIRAKNRDQLRSFLQEKNIGTEIYYPIPLHKQKCFLNLGYPENAFPVTNKATEEVLALPIYPELSQDELNTICNTILEFYSDL